MGWTKRGVERIKKLTAKEEAQLPVIADKWNKIATSTEPWDTEALKDGIKRFIKSNGCRQPKRGFFYCRAPQYTLEASGFQWESVKKYNPNFETNLERSEFSMRCRFHKTFDPVILRRVESFMHRNVARSLSTRLIRHFSTPRKERDRNVAYGQGDAPWLAIVDYFGTVFDNEHAKKLDGLLQAVASCGFVCLAPTKVIYCNRPEIAKFDDQGRLHCVDAPAIVYGSSGESDWEGKIWGVNFLNGVAVAKKYIETLADDLKVDEVLQEQNSDVRAAVLRKIGFARLLATVPNRIISQADGNSLIQLQITRGFNGSLRVLRLKWQDKTGAKETLLSVPRLSRDFGDDCPQNINDCEQVRRWTLGWPKEAMAVAET